MVTLFLRRSASALSVEGGPLALALVLPAQPMGAGGVTYEVKNPQGAFFVKTL